MDYRASAVFDHSIDAMRLTLSDILPNEGRVIEVCHSACGRRLGRYSTSADEGRIELYDDPHPEAEPYRKPTGARRFNVLMTHGRNIRYQWRCGCGEPDIQRRADRLGRLEVDMSVDPPRVYVG